jgi:hypothetical protein
MDYRLRTIHYISIGSIVSLPHYNFARSLSCCYFFQDFKKYNVLDSNVLTFSSLFVKFSSLVQKWKYGDTDTHRQRGDTISLLFTLTHT